MGFVSLGAPEPVHGKPNRSDATAAGEAPGWSAQCAQKREKLIYSHVPLADKA